MNAAFACQCSQPGLCPVFGRVMGPKPLAICRGEVLTPEQCDAYRDTWRRLAAGELVLPPADAPPAVPGPGTELAKLIATLQLRAKDCSSCSGMIAQMNVWGVDGCRAHRAEIVEQLDRNYHKLTWAEVLAAASSAIATLLALKINPLDISGSLVDLAIDQAAQNLTSAA
jgi:hypothetical protein